MSYDEVTNIWNAGNEPGRAEREALKNEFVRRLDRRRRQELAWLAWTFFMLTALTVSAGWLVFATDKVNLGTEWAVIPLLLIPWVFAIVFLRRFLRGGRVTNRGDVTIRESLKAALAANRGEAFKMKALGVMYSIAIPVLAICVWQLEIAGKVHANEVISMMAFLGGVLALSAAAVAARFWFGVVPEERKLRGLLSQFE